MSRTGDPYPLVRSPWGRTSPAPDLSPAEAAFETAPTPPEVREAEQWRPVLGYEGLYEVSNIGRVRGLVRGRVLAGYLPPRSGYWTVTLRLNGQARVRKIHQLVLEAFVGERPPGMIACHNDGDRTNNTVGNLRWDSPRANNLDTLRHGTHPQASKTHCDSGHPFSGSNLVVSNRRTERICRQCQNDWARVRNARRVACECGVTTRINNLARHRQGRDCTLGSAQVGAQS